MGKKLEQARREAGITQNLLGQAVARTRAWVYLVETGRLRVPSDVEAHLLQAIKNLAEYRDAINGTRERLFRSLRLPVRLRSAKKFLLTS